MLPIKKLYIDTRTRTLDSVSSSNFKIELIDTLFMPSNSIFFIDNISIPHSWYTIEQNVNGKLYVQLTNNNSNVNLKPNECRIVQITAGNYNIATLAAELETKLNTSFASTIYTSPVFTVVANAIENHLTITPLYSDLLIKILTDIDLKTEMNGVTINSWDGSWLGDSYDTNNSKDMNNILSNNTGQPSTFFSQASPFVSGYIDLQPVKNLYISSPNLGTYITISPDGSRTCLKKVPVNANQHQMILSESTNGNDYLDCSKQTLKTIQFELKDVYGNHVNLHGANWSYSLVFSKYRSEVE